MSWPYAGLPSCSGVPTRAWWRASQAPSSPTQVRPLSCLLASLPPFTYIHLALDVISSAGHVQFAPHGPKPSLTLPLWCLSVLIVDVLRNEMFKVSSTICPEVHSLEISVLALKSLPERCLEFHVCGYLHGVLLCGRRTRGYWTHCAGCGGMKARTSSCGKLTMPLCLS
jgi:hypothetical protein